MPGDLDALGGTSESISSANCGTAALPFELLWGWFCNFSLKIPVIQVNFWKKKKPYISY